MPIDENAQSVAIVAQFRTLDNQKSSWRIVLKRNELDPDKARVIEVEKSAMTLQPVK